MPVLIGGRCHAKGAMYSPHLSFYFFSGHISCASRVFEFAVLKNWNSNYNRRFAACVFQVWLYNISETLGRFSRTSLCGRRFEARRQSTQPDFAYYRLIGERYVTRQDLLP